MTWADDLRDTCLGDVSVAARVIEAVEKLLDLDLWLLDVAANERSISHRLAIYIEERFPEWHVDCEYNRDGVDPKRISPGSGDDREEGSRVLPDIIVHRRGGRNFIVLELKKSTNREPDEDDLQKLADYCNELRYEYGVFIRFNVAPLAAGIARALFVHREQ